jgi:hypothetical protein
LEAGRHVRRVADRRVVHAQVIADLPHHDQPRVQPHAHDQFLAGREPKLASALWQDLLNAQGGEDGLTGMVLVGKWRAEERHEAIA